MQRSKFASRAQPRCRSQPKLPLLKERRLRNAVAAPKVVAAKQPRSPLKEKPRRPKRNLALQKPKKLRKPRKPPKPKKRSKANYNLFAKRTGNSPLFIFQCVKLSVTSILRSLSS